MKNKLLVQQFIEQHPDDWEKLLQEKPYCLLITRDNLYGRDLIMFKYNMVESSFAEPLVCECRGLILDAKTFEVVSFPFTKFFNAHELYAANLDWKTAKVATKVDGSLMKVELIGDNLLVSTNGTIDAFKAPIAKQIGCTANSFGELFVEGIVDAFYDKIDWDRFGLPLFSDTIEKECIDFFKWNLEEGYTYMFELVSPFSKVVIPYKETKLYYLGRRNNNTFQEEHFSKDPFNGAFMLPDIYPLQTLDQCLAATAVMPWDEEGYVACDANFNRVKIKSPAYLAVHGLKNNGVMSYARAVEIVRLNEIDEICAYFEEFRPALEECKTRFWKLVEDCENTWNEYLKIDNSLPTRKDKALWITKNFKIPGLAFGLLDKKINSVRDFFMTSPADKIIKYLGYKE